jgi:hypothetical protein
MIVAFVCSHARQSVENDCHPNALPSVATIQIDRTILIARVESIES